MLNWLGNMPGDTERQRSKPSIQSFSIFERVWSLWSANVAVDFFSDEGILSDHLGELTQVRQTTSLIHIANERTFHNWLALSNATSWMGIIVAQMSKISKVVRSDHSHMLRYKACICQVVSMIILLIGMYRFFREQSGINRTGRRASQWTLLTAGLFIFMVSLFTLGQLQ